MPRSSLEFVEIFLSFVFTQRTAESTFSIFCSSVNASVPTGLSSTRLINFVEGKNFDKQARQKLTNRLHRSGWVLERGGAVSDVF